MSCSWLLFFSDITNKKGRNPFSMTRSLVPIFTPIFHQKINIPEIIITDKNSYPNTHVTKHSITFFFYRMNIFSQSRIKREECWWYKMLETVLTSPNVVLELRQATDTATRWAKQVLLASWPRGNICLGEVRRLAGASRPRGWGIGVTGRGTNTAGRMNICIQTQTHSHSLTHTYIYRYRYMCINNDIQ